MEIVSNRRKVEKGDVLIVSARKTNGRKPDHKKFRSWIEKVKFRVIESNGKLHAVWSGDLGTKKHTATFEITEDMMIDITTES